MVREDSTKFVANENMAGLLAAKAYTYHFLLVKNATHCDRALKEQTLPEALLWRTCNIFPAYQSGRPDERRDSPVQSPPLPSCIRDHERDASLLQRSGQVLLAAALAQEFGINDVDGRQPMPLTVDTV